MRHPIIALLTDFGAVDPYVGAVKGVLASRAPRARWIDLTHEVPPGNVTAGAFLLRSCVPYFPKGTVFLTVVDPGVGSARRALALEAGGRFFVGPDNGLLPAALSSLHPVRRAVELRNPAFRLREVSATFHGRDVFAPAAAALACGVRLSRLGPPLTRLVPGRISAPRRVAGGVRGEVLWIDRFGNAVTNLEPRHLPDFREVRVRGARLGRRIGHFAEGERGKVAVLWGSFGTLEIVVNRGNAARKLGLRIGSPVFAIRDGKAESLPQKDRSPRRSRK